MSRAVYCLGARGTRPGAGTREQLASSSCAERLGRAGDSPGVCPASARGAPSGGGGWSPSSASSQARWARDPDSLPPSPRVGRRPTVCRNSTDPGCIDWGAGGWAAGRGGRKDALHAPRDKVHAPGSGEKAGFAGLAWSVPGTLRLRDDFRCVCRVCLQFAVTRHAITVSPLPASLRGL